MHECFSDQVKKLWDFTSFRMTFQGCFVILFELWGEEESLLRR